MMANRSNTGAFWSFHFLIHVNKGDLARHVGQSGKNVSHLQRMWQMCSCKSKVGFWGGWRHRNGDSKHAKLYKWESVDAVYGISNK